YSTIMMFVNLIDYGGQSVEVAMQDWKAKNAINASISALAEDNGLSITDTTIAMAGDIVPFTGVTISQRYEDEVLDFLTKLKEERAKGITSQSELFTDKVNAVSQVITPELISNSVQTKALTTNSIIGGTPGALSMSIVDNKLIVHGVPRAPTVPTSLISTSTELASAVAGFDLNIGTTTEGIAATTATSTAASATTTAPQNDIVVSFDTEGNAFFAGELIAQKVSTGALDVSGPAIFNAGLIVSEIGSASTTVNVLSDTFFFGRPYFTSDTGGTATIKEGAREVEVLFDREYVEKPILNASMVFTASTTDENIDKIFGDDVRFVITKRTTSGFTITLSKKASHEVTFNWVALAVKDSKEFTSRTIEPESILPPLAPAEIPTEVSTTTPVAITTPEIFSDIMSTTTATTTTEETDSEPQIPPPDTTIPPEVVLPSGAEPFPEAEPAVSSESPPLSSSGDMIE
ncbi:MAG: hypothetical protein AAB920_01480, partial [Patescibacteria group bacterium]